MEQKINESTAILWDVENIHPKQTGSIIEKIEDSFVTAKIIPAVDSLSVNEVLIMSALNLPLGEQNK